MTRRGFLLAFVALLLVGVVRWVREIAARGAPGGTLATRLRGYFDYLSFDDDVIAAFVRDYQADTPRIHRREPTDAIASRFLLSTDFFQNGANEAHPLHYVRYYDPYRSPCYNPLTQEEGRS